nr:leucine zipper domain-containing protein [Streptomyces musisoli]
MSCRCFGISRQAYYTWYRRYQADGGEGLRTRSKAPKTSPNAFGIALLGQVAPIDTIKKALVDQGFKKTVVEHGTTVGIDVEIVERNPTDKDVGFVPQAKRWIVEQTLGILMLFRLLVRDYESRPKSSESRVRWALIDVIARRLIGQTTSTWRG